MGILERSCRSINNYVGCSRVGRYFRLEGSNYETEIPGTLFTTEVRAGITTFFTMAYIIAVNASIISQSGGTCVCTNTTDPSCVNDVDYNACLQELNRDIITATAAIASLSSILFGLFTNMPVALAPGMSVNAYFTYQIVGYHGTGPVPYRLALAAVFIEGIIFFFLSITGIRHWLVKLVPSSIKAAFVAGIGLYLSFVGLGYSSGLGLITKGQTTVLEIAGCPPEYLESDLGYCTSHKMQNPQLWIGVCCGGLLTAWLMLYKTKSAMVLGILLVSVISWPRDTSFTYFPHTAEGESRFEFFKKVVAFHPIQHTLNAIDWDLTKAGSHFVVALFTLLYVDICDTTGTLYSMARFSGVVDLATGEFPRATLAYCTDSICISIGALLGTSPNTAYIESAAGIAEGGRTGLTAITTGFCFFLSLFFSPIFASIPPWATGGIIVLVGCIMMRCITEVNWGYLGDAVPAFVTVIAMPFTNSVAYGLIAGLFTYTVINGVEYITRKLTRGRIVPPEEDYREYWSINPGGTPPWFIRAMKDKSIFPRSEKRGEPSLSAMNEENSGSTFAESSFVQQLARVKTASTGRLGPY